MALRNVATGAATADEDGRVREVLAIEARGAATWSGEPYLVEAGRWTVEVENRDGTERAAVTRYVVLWRRASEPEVPLALRPMNKVLATPEERDDFIMKLAPEARLSMLDQPEVVGRTHALAEIVGEVLIQVWFVTSYVQLHFQPDGVEPIPTHRSPLTCDTTPLVHVPGRASLAHGQEGYADRLVNLIGMHVVAVDEYLDEGLTIAFENGAGLSIPLEATDDGYEVATFRTPHWLRVWTPGESPHRPADRRPA